MGKTGNKKKQTGSAEVSGEDDHESYVLLATVKAMLAIQESTIISMFDSTIKTLNSQIDILNSKVTNLKASLEFSQKEVADLKQLAPKVNGLQCEMDAMKVTSNQQENKLEYIENQSRRNNIRVSGIPETLDETWEQAEEKVKDAIKSSLDIEIDIERAHRVERRAKSKNSGGQDHQPPKPRTIVCKLGDWKQREQVLREARVEKPAGVVYI